MGAKNLTTTRSIPYDRCPPLQRDSQPSRELRSRQLRANVRLSQPSRISPHLSEYLSHETSSSTNNALQAILSFCFRPSLSPLRLFCLHLPNLFIFGASLHQILSFYSEFLQINFAHFLIPTKNGLFSANFLLKLFQEFTLITLIYESINQLPF